MATESGRESSGIPDPAPSSRQAQDVLAGLDADRVRLAQRVATPWWYHSALGGILAAIVISYALLPLGYPVLVVVAGLVAMVLLVRIYSRRYGVEVAGWVGPRTRRLQAAVGVLVGVCILSSLVIMLVGVSAWWALLPTAAVFCGIIVLGRRYDEAMRGEIVRGDGGPR